MLTNQLAFKYAQAVYELASEQHTADRLAGQLGMVAGEIAGNAELSAWMYNPRVPADGKKDVLQRVFGDELDVTLHNFLLLLIDKHRETLLPDIVLEYKQLQNEASGTVEADVKTARPLTAEQHEALAAKLSALTKKNIVLRPEIDERIVGGVIIRIGDKLIDGSVVRRLSALKAMLLKTEVTKIGVTDGV